MEKDYVEHPAHDMNSSDDGAPSELPSNQPRMPCCCQIRLPDKCNMPCGSHKVESRNLIVCIDGTANQFGEKNTNVIEMYNLILKEEHHNQRTWYNSGIGTYVRPSVFSPEFYKQWVYHKIDLAIAWDFKKTILGAYRWLSDNYEPGDCIFLFGFSRGAYQVRVLAGMIEKVGLIFKGNEMQIPFAYELYADRKSGLPSEDITTVGQPTQQASQAERFKKAFSREGVSVHFVGVWDTVSSVGIVRGKNILPKTIEGMKHVCYFRHALALDERRVKFLPEYAYGGYTKPATPEQRPKGKSASNQRPSGNLPSTEDKHKAESLPTCKVSSGSLPHTKEVWFAGTHSDIGGGNVRNTAMNRARPPLRWMVFEAVAVGLRTATFERELLAKEQINIIESLTWPWLPFEICPIKRLTFTRKENCQLNTTRMPHRGTGRKIHPGQKIHHSLLRADSADPEIPQYIPKAHHLDGNLFWQALREGNTQEWLELDLYEYIRDMVETLTNSGDGTDLKTLQYTTISSDARKNLYDAVIEALERKALKPEVKHRLLELTIGALNKIRPDFRLSTRSKIRPLLSDLLGNERKNYQKTAKDFVRLFTESCRVVHLENFFQPMSMQFEGKHLVSGSADMAVRVWDVETGKLVGRPLRHKFWVSAAAISSDGKRVVSGSHDDMIRVWDVETGKPVGKPLGGQEELGESVAISPDGTRVASASDDGVVWVWDVETGKQVGKPFEHQTDEIVSITISPDGKHIFSGSSNGAVCVWDLETGKLVGEPLRGHNHWVFALAISSDGKHVVSGSHDKTIRVWDVEKGKPLGEPLRGLTHVLTSVAISSDGKRIVSGSHDKTVRVWDAETGKALGEPLRGHTDVVLSVGFLSDDKWVVSSSQDGTIRIWDLEAYDMDETNWSQADLENES